MGILYLSSSWPGLGLGDSSSDELFQAGTEQDLTPTIGRTGCTGVSLDYYPWWEIYPRFPDQQGIAWGISVGDTMYLDLYLSGSQVEFFFEDVTTGDYSSFGESSSGFSGESAELILERTEYECDLWGLPQGSTTTFTDAEVAINGTYKGPGEWHYVDDTISDDAGTLLAEPGSFSNSGENITNDWKAGGDVDQVC